MSGVNPRASFNQGPSSWSPNNPVDAQLTQQFAAGSIPFFTGTSPLGEATSANLRKPYPSYKTEGGNHALSFVAGFAFGMFSSLKRNSR